MSQKAEKISTGDLIAALHGRGFIVMKKPEVYSVASRVRINRPGGEVGLTKEQRLQETADLLALDIGHQTLEAIGILQNGEFMKASGHVIFSTGGKQ
ncbi:hypothetical protein [uncultured Pelagimonas sp.]|uniref:hypothetical protein n=1 Tax=uncultured Pelagimonas sp. TaxID=1618102 RepID=UPI0026167C60|nr:hypothetical protein [uncultured Pelagimonas sp.]